MEAFGCGKDGIISQHLKFFKKKKHDVTTTSDQCFGK